MSSDALAVAVARRAFTDETPDSIRQRPDVASTQVDSDATRVSNSYTPGTTVSLSALREELESANQQLSTTGLTMSLGVDQESGRIVVTLIDQKTKNTVLQIPSDTALNLDRRLEQLTGIILNRYG